jgi:NTP pyrophosphatase (non-canonical NTP hydrolase)
MYKIYHIPGKKIGVTRDLTNRVTEQQGYAPGEYEVLLTSDDINEISNMEIELQKSYGYKVDRQSYKNLINKNKKMKVNVTEQTTTFPCPLNKLKGQLLDNLDLSWDTSHGEFTLSASMIPWIMANSKISMFNTNRSYIYNKAFYEAFFNPERGREEILGLVEEVARRPDKSFYAENEENVYDLIRSWAKDKGIYAKGDSKTQYLKLMEEAGELAEALLKNDRPEIIDAIGDMVVVLTNLAALEDLRIEDCVTSAYDVIKSRQGKMVNGTFVKEEVIPEDGILNLKYNTRLTNNFHNRVTNTL